MECQGEPVPISLAATFVQSTLKLAEQGGEPGSALELAEGPEM